MTNGLSEYLHEAFRGRQYKATVVILASTLLLITWKYFGTADFYHARLTSVFQLFGDADYSAAVYMFSTSFVVLGLFPLAIVKAVFRDPLADYGISFGAWKKGALALLVFGPLFLLAS